MYPEGDRSEKSKKGEASTLIAASTSIAHLPKFVSVDSDLVLTNPIGHDGDARLVNFIKHPPDQVFCCGTVTRSDANKS